MPNEKPNPDDTLSKVLAYVDSPFKLIAVLVMGGCGLLRVFSLAEPRIVGGGISGEPENALHRRRQN